MKLAYIMSRYPKITETFILNEVLSLQKEGVSVELFPLLREKTNVVHPNAFKLMDKVTFTPLISLTMLFYFFRTLVCQPIKLLSTLWTLIRVNWSCNNFLFGALAYFPKAVYLASLCKEREITHIHAHFANHPAMVAYVIHRLADISYSFTAHGSDLHKRQHMLQEKIAAAKFTVMVSEYNKAFTMQHIDEKYRDKLHIVRCGVDTQLFRNKALSKKNKDAIYLLCVASLREVKGHKYLIEACAIIKQQGVPFHLKLIGEGPKRRELEQQITSMGLKEHIQLLGAQPQEVILSHLAQSDIFTLTSFQTKSGNREGVPVVIMEAMACGLPVVASNVSGIPELVLDNKTGLLCGTQNPEDIASKLKSLCLDNERRLQFGIAGRTFIEQEFDLSVNTKKLVALFKTFSEPSETTDKSA